MAIVGDLKHKFYLHSKPFQHKFRIQRIHFGNRPHISHPAHIFRQQTAYFASSAHLVILGTTRADISSRAETSMATLNHIQCPMGTILITCGSITRSRPHITYGASQRKQGSSGINQIQWHNPIAYPINGNG